MNSIAKILPTQIVVILTDGNYCESKGFMDGVDTDAEREEYISEKKKFCEGCGVKFSYEIIRAYADQGGGSCVLMDKRHPLTLEGDKPLAERSLYLK